MVHLSSAIGLLGLTHGEIDYYEPHPRYYIEAHEDLQLCLVDPDTDGVETHPTKQSHSQAYNFSLLDHSTLSSGIRTY